MDNKKKTICKECEQTLKQSQEQVKNLQEETESWKGKYLRALADYQNFEKRVSVDKEDLRKTANQFFIMRLLPFIDNLERAEVFVKDKNLQMIKQEFVKLLQQEGIEEVVVLDTEFDPYSAEAIDIIPGEKDNMVVDVLRKGYKFQGRLIRPAQVRVSKKVQISKVPLRPRSEASKDQSDVKN